MKVEEYVNPHNNKTYVKVGIVGVLKERLELVYGNFERFEGEMGFGGWWKIKVSGIEKPVEVSNEWLSSNPSLIEGEALEILLDKFDNKAWKIARVSSPEVASEGSPQTEQAQLQAKVAVAETPAANTETVKKQEWV